MSRLRKEFTEKEWKKCCGSFCKDCDVANAYRKKYGKKEGEKSFLRIRKKLINLN